MMQYHNANNWQNAREKRVMLFGMSGLGKTHLSNILRSQGNWFHYSVDYRIGTHYMDQYIVDNFKHEAMRNPFFAQLLQTDSIEFTSNITFDNLAPLSTYMGKPGNAALGGIDFDQYVYRQQEHHEAEVAALMDTEQFITKSREIHGYDNFICDSGGSICEVVDPNDPEDLVLKTLSDNLLMVWIKGLSDHTDTLVERFKKEPKPMYFGDVFLKKLWRVYLKENNCVEGDVNPDLFMLWAYRQTLEHRLPRYRAMAENWGIAIDAKDVGRIKTPGDFEALIAQVLADER